MIAELEKDFARTSQLLLGAALAPMDDYAGWLGRRVPLPHLTKSALSGKPVWLPPPPSFRNTLFTTKRAISMEEVEKVSATPFSASDLEGAGLADLAGRLTEPVRYLCGNYRYRTYENVEECSGAGDGRNLYRSEDAYLKIKNVAYSNYTLFCESMFGCHADLHSKFCIHTYNSENVARCFEVDGCADSSDLLFCHNCEGMGNALLCFNAKNMHYAVGNVEVGREKYVKIRQKVLAEITAKLVRDKKLELDIYNVGCTSG
ncbi:MAG: hypothetical protein PHS02_00670 [Candidatus ainarchaeum sp.]|nr:hypothetical protein [Candidatus ainarchaeum sp.]